MFESLGSGFRTNPVHHLPNRLGGATTPALKEPPLFSPFLRMGIDGEAIRAQITSPKQSQKQNATEAATILSASISTVIGHTRLADRLRDKASIRIQEAV